MEFVNWLLLIPVGFVFFVWVLKRLNGLYYAVKLGKKWTELPPGELGWPLVGSTLSFVKSFTVGSPQNFFLRTFSNRFGKVDMYKTHMFGRATILVCTPDLCHQVLTDETTFVPSYPTNIKTLFGRKSLIQVSKAEHRRLRRLITGPISGHAALEMYINHIEHTVINDLEEWSSMKKPLELLTEMKTLTFKVIWNIFMGSTTLGYSWREMEGLFYAVSLGIFSLPINFPGFTFHKSLKARERLLEMLQSILNEKRLVKKNKGESWEAKDMMDLLMDVRDEDGKEMDDETIIDLILGKLFGGHETSAYTAMWALLFLTDNPPIYQKAKDEQEDIIKRRPSTQKGINLSEVKQMKFLSQVIDETLRVSRMSFAIFRETTVDVKINGKIIPKGWRVIAWLRELYMDEKLHPSPQDFNPSRWDNFIAKPGAFTLFGLGVRLCPGRDLAKFEISIFLHYFLLNYKMERLNPQCPLTYLPVPHPKDKCLARVLKAA